MPALPEVSANPPIAVLELLLVLRVLLFCATPLMLKLLSAWNRALLVTLKLLPLIVILLSTPAPVAIRAKLLVEIVEAWFFSV